MKLKTIGITQRTFDEGKGATRDALQQDYVQYYEQFGITLIPIPNVSKIDHYFELLDGIILSGGNSSEEREQTEHKLLDHAVKNNIPVLAECHGLQTVNKYFGGTQTDRIKDATGQNHVLIPHKIKIINEQAQQFLDKKETTVNSYHDNGVLENNLAKSMTIIAKAEDNSIEAFHHPDHPIAAIMWHPERENSDHEMDKKLVNAFLNRELFWSS